jgi:RHS repeat-associated protein
VQLTGGPSLRFLQGWDSTNREGVTGKTNYEPLSVSAGTNNRLSGFGYDAAGNMTSNGSATYIYDDENRLIATAANSYIYDGDGERVEKCTEGTTPGTCATSATGTMYWRGAGSDPLSETDLAGNILNVYIFFGGQRIARSDSTGGIHYYFSDHLGSHGVVENATGSACEQDVDYYPYGGEENDYCTTPVAQNYKFTGKERDAESGLDNFGARYDASSLGRFMTPDWAAKATAVPYASFGDPQTLNLYAYTGNSPLNRIDADGHTVPTAANPVECGAGGVICTRNEGGRLVENVLDLDDEGDVPTEVIQGDGTFSAQNQKTVTVTVDQVKAANPLGHVVIQVGGGQKVGLVPDSDKAAAMAAAKEAASAAAGFPAPSTVPGHVEPLEPSRTIEDTAVLHVTPDQAKAMQGTIDKSILTLHTYDPGFGNCATFVESVLRSGGAKAPNDMTPGGLVEDLKHQKPQ